LKLIKDALLLMEKKLGGEALIIVWYLGRCLGETIANEVKLRKTAVTTVEDALKSVALLSQLKLYEFSLEFSANTPSIKVSEITSNIDEALAKGILEGYFKTLLGTKVLAEKERSESVSRAVLFTLIF